MGNGVSPFFVKYNFHPATLDPPGEEGPLNPASTVYGHWMQTVHEESRKGLEVSQERMRRYTDLAPKEPPAYQVGDLVMFNGRNIKTRRPTKKLDHKNHDSFQIEKIISPLAIRLLLPRKWKIHNVFHVSLLEPYRTSEYWTPPDPSKVLREADDIEQSAEYDVEVVRSSVECGRGVTLGLYCNRSVERVNGNQTTFDNLQWNDLSSFVRGFFVESAFDAVSSFSTGRNFSSYIAFFWCHVVPLENPYFSSTPRILSNSQDPATPRVRFLRPHWSW